MNVRKLTYEKDSKSLPAAARGPAPCEDVSSTHRLTARTEDGHLKHDPATCWWCQNAKGQLTPCVIRAYVMEVTEAVDALRFSGYKSPVDRFAETIR